MGDIQGQVDGYGKRLNKLEIDFGKSEVEVNNIQTDIGEIKVDVKELSKGQTAIRTTLSRAAGALAVIYILIQVGMKFISGGDHVQADSQARPAPTEAVPGDNR